MSASPMSGRRRGTLARGKTAHHTYQIEKSPGAVVVRLEADADHDLLVNRDGSPPYLGKADRQSRSGDGSETITVEAPDGALGIGVRANEDGEYQVAIELRDTDDGDEDDSRDGGPGGQPDTSPRGPAPNKPHRVVVDTFGGGAGLLEYRFAVSGAVEQVASESDDRSLIESAAEIDGSVVTGVVSSGDHHVFRYSGDLVESSFEGPGRVIHDGEVIYVETPR